MSSELDGIEQVISMSLIGCAVLNYIRVIRYVFCGSLCSCSEKDKIVKSQRLQAIHTQHSALLDYITNIWIALA